MRRRGFTLIEVLTTCSVGGMLILGCMSLMSFGLRTYQTTSTDIDLTQTNANGCRRVTETIRQAMNIEIKNGGTRIEFSMPALSSTPDPITGERELLDPLTPESTIRAFEVVNGQLRDVTNNRVLVRNIVATDPRPGSSQYGQTYAPFQVTTIGSRRAVTVNLITDRQVLSGERYVRMKTTVLIRNSS